MSSPSPIMPIGHADPDAVLWHPTGTVATLVNAGSALARLLTPLFILLGLVIVPALLVLPFAIPAAAAALLAQALGLKPVALTFVAVMAAGMVIGLGVPFTRVWLLGYFQRLQDLSNTLPTVLRVKAGEVAYLRRRMAPAAPDPLPTWRFAEVEGPATIIVRGGREVIWNGTREGYDTWLSETDLASL